MDDSINKNWGGSELFSNKNFPFTQVNALESYDLSSIQSYVQNVLSQVSTMDDALLKAEVFETHQWVIAKIKISSQILARSLRIRVNSHHMVISRTQNSKDQIIHFPCKVNPLARKSVYKSGILEIRMPKLKYKERYHEVEL